MLSLIILISSCTLNDFDKVRKVDNFSIEIETPNDKYNIYFKENVTFLIFATINI